MRVFIHEKEKQGIVTLELHVPKWGGQKESGVFREIQDQGFGFGNWWEILS